MRKVVFFFAVVALAISVVTTAPRSTQAQAEPIPLGVAVIQTGRSSLLGQDEVTGARIAEKYFNDKGGVNGRPIKLFFEDTGDDANGAVNAFNKLISQNNVVGILGPTLSTQAQAADPVANAAGVPVIAPSNTAAGIPQIGYYVARVSAPIALVAPSAVQAALNLNKDIKKVAVFYAQDDVFSTSETGTFQATVKSLGLELLPVQQFSVKDTDFTTQITNALQGNPDLAIVSGLATDGGNLVKQLRENGFKGQIIGGNGLNTPNIFPVCQSACDGMLIAQAYSYQAENPVNKDLRAIYNEQQKAEPGQFVGQAFTGIQVFVEALTALDKATPLSGLDLKATRDGLAKAIEAGTYNTPLGEISFTRVKNKDGQIAGLELNQKQFYVAQIKMESDGKTGKFVFLDAKMTMAPSMDMTPEATASK